MARMGGKEKTEIFDLGCGFLEDHKQRGTIGIDLQKGKCDIVGDIRFLPFRSDISSKIYARNILEHLEPEDLIFLMREIRRISKKGALISISIPIYHNPMIDELIKLICGFPFRFPRTIRRMKRFTSNKSKRGFIHKNKVTPEHISLFFKILTIRKIYWKTPLLKFWNPKPDNYYVLAKK